MVKALGWGLGRRERQKKPLTLPVGLVQETAQSWPMRMTGPKRWTNRFFFIDPCQIDVPKGPPIHPLLSMPTAITLVQAWAPGSASSVVSLPPVLPSSPSSLHTEVTLRLYTWLHCLQLFDGFPLPSR